MKKTGKTALLFLMGILLWTGVSAQCLSGDCTNGYGSVRYSNGDVYEGTFSQGLRVEGSYSYVNGDKYVGRFKANGNNEYGTMSYASGDVFTGEFNEKNIRSKGIYYFKNDESFEGTFVNGRRNNGTFKAANGEVFVGQFNQDRKYDFGTLSYANGNKFEGSFHANGNRKEGRFTYASGTVIICTFDEQGNYLAGRGYYADGGYFEGTFYKNGVRKQGRFVYEDGQFYIGSFDEINGARNGYGKYDWKNGNVYEGNWLNGKKHGAGKLFYNNVISKEGFWENDLFVSDVNQNQQTNVPQGAKFAGRVYAVIVGVAKYKDINSLNYSDDDAYKVYSFLKSPEGGALPDEQIVVLVDEDAKKQNIIDQLTDLSSKATSTDLLIFYFSGHGKQGAFLPFDFDGKNNTLEHALISDIMNKGAAKHKIVIADACHSGSLDKAMKSYDIPEIIDTYYEALDQSLGGTGTALMMSSKADETSIEYKGIRQGVFSHFLIKGLKGEADTNGNKIVTVKELFAFVESNTKTYTQNAQSPKLNGEGFDPEMPVGVLAK